MLPPHNSSVPKKNVEFGIRSRQLLIVNPFRLFLLKYRTVQLNGRVRGHVAPTIALDLKINK